MTKGKGAKAPFLVAIVGGAPRSQDLPPYDDPKWEIWSLGSLVDPRLDLCFEIHDDLTQRQDGYAQRLVAKKIPLIVGNKFPVKDEHVTVFPFDKVSKLMPEEHLTSSIAYMMALAVLEGATHIKVYGVDMDVDDREYFHQRAGMYAWIFYARGLGIQVDVPESSLLKERRYPGGNGTPPFTQAGFLNIAKIHIEQMEAIQTQVKELEILYATHDGCKQSYERLAKVARATEAGIEVNSLADSAKIRRHDEQSNAPEIKRQRT